MVRFAMDDDGGTLHVAKRKRGGWKVLREGTALPLSTHDERTDALQAAKAVAEERPGSLIKVHREDNTLESVIPFSEIIELPA